MILKMRIYKIILWIYLFSQSPNLSGVNFLEYCYPDSEFINIFPCNYYSIHTLLDPDGTPSDIGALPSYSHDYHIVDATAGRVRWRSFPVLDNILSEGELTEYVCAPVEDQTSWFSIKNQFEQHTIWEEEQTPGWNPVDIYNLDSKIGYKIESNHNVTIPVIGFKQSDDTVIELSSGQSNWIGYFIEENMSVSDALAGIWDHVRSVRSEDWYYIKNGPITPLRCAFLYGKMYDVEVYEDCSFVYGDKTTPIDPKEREMTTGFTYQESPDYTPIAILDPGDESVEEIGIYQGDECIGAAKVEELPVQILAFDTDQRENGEISFQFYYGDRTYQKKKDYYVYHEYSDNFSAGNFSLNPYEQVIVTFDAETSEMPVPQKLSIGNYPNPFNPTTQIKYSLPKDTNVKLEIYNIKGQKITTLVDEKKEAGYHAIDWSSTDETGKSVSSGMYFYRLTTDDKVLNKKMMLLK